MQQYLKQHDWFVPSVSFDDTWIKNETQLYDLMKETKFMDRNAPVPAFEAIKPATAA